MSMDVDTEGEHTVGELRTEVIPTKDSILCLTEYPSVSFYRVLEVIHTYNKNRTYDHFDKDQTLAVIVEHLHTTTEVEETEV